MPKPVDPQRTTAETRMIKTMTEKGGQRFRVLRSAESGMRQYRRPATRAAAQRGESASR